MNKDLKNRLVSALRTGPDATVGREPIPVGKSYAFPGSGDAYTYQDDGSYRRLGKTKMTKAEKKAARRARREDREQAQKNLQAAETDAI